MREFVTAVDRGLTPCGNMYRWDATPIDCVSMRCEREVDHPGMHRQGMFQWLHEGEKRPSKRAREILRLKDELAELQRRFNDLCSSNVRAIERMGIQLPDEVSEGDLIAAMDTLKERYVEAFAGI